MLFGRKKPSQAKGRSKGLLLLLAGGFWLALTHLARPGKIKELENRIKAFAREEKRELSELERGEEGYCRFIRDSVRLSRDYFIPHAGNGHKPKILRPRALAIIAAMALTAKLLAVGYLFLSYPPDAYMSEILTNEVLRLMNTDRIAAGKSELRSNAALEQSALAKASDLIDNDYFAHTSLDGKKPWDWIDRGQYAYIFVGENLAMNFTSAQSVHQALMNSPTHKKNILNERYADIGLAMATGKISGKLTNVLVQHFGARSAAVPAASAGAPEPSPVPPPAAAAPQEREEQGPVPQVLSSPLSASAGAPELSSVPPPAREETALLTPPSQTLARADEAPVRPELLAAEAVRPSAPDYRAMEAELPARVRQAPAQEIDQAVPVVRTVRLANYFFIAMAALMAAALLVNILVRLEIQHKPVIIQTLALILFISSLAYFKFHALEEGIREIFII